MLAGSYCRMSYAGNLDKYARIIERILTKIEGRREMHKKTAAASHRGRCCKMSYPGKQTITQKNVFLA